MNAGETVTAMKQSKPRRKNRKSDGSDGAPIVSPPTLTAGAQVQRISAAGAANSALKEAVKPGEGVQINHPARDRNLVVADAANGIVTGGTRKKIAVCGFASSSRDLVPVNDPAWEVWGLNQLYRHLSRADRWFDIHYYWEHEVVPGTEGSFDDPGSYRHWMASSGIPVYMHHLVPEIPTCVRYPIERMIARHEADYFTSTIAFMIAIAIDEIDQRVAADLKVIVRKMRKAALVQADLPTIQKDLYRQYTIGVFGVDLIVGEEYFWQKSCAEYWLGAASARGIMVALPPQTALCKQMYRYGYEKEPDTIIKLSDIASHTDQMQKQRDEAMRQLYCLDGALQANEYWKQLVELRLRGLHRE